MAEVEQVGLLIDGETLYGVSSPGEHVVSWRFGGQGPDSPEGQEGLESPESPEGAEGSNSSTLQPFNHSTIPLPTFPSLSAALSAARDEIGAGDGCVLALPPDVLVTKVIPLPAVEPEAIGPMVRLQMEKFAPTSGDALAVASEVVGATEDSTRVFAVAMPMDRLDALAEDLGEAGVVLTRIDSSLLCEWRMFQDCPSKPDLPPCHAVVFHLPSGRFDIAIADEAGLVFARSLGTGLDRDALVREIVLSVLDLGEGFAGLSPEKIVFVSDEPPEDALVSSIRESLGADVGHLPASELGDPVIAVIRRDDEEGHIDIVPQQWRDAESQSAGRRRFIAGVIAAMAVWAVLLAGLLLAPVILQKASDKVQSSITAIDAEYQHVSDTRTKVRLIRSYQDRSHSLLETFRDICAGMPDGLVFSSLSYEKGGETVVGSKTKSVGGFKVAGDADSFQTITTLKDFLDALGPFAPATISGVSLDSKRQRQRFEIDSRFKDGEDEQ